MVIKHYHINVRFFSVKVVILYGGNIISETVSSHRVDDMYVVSEREAHCI